MQDIPKQPRTKTFLADHNGNVAEVGADLTHKEAMEKLMGGFPVVLLRYKLDKVTELQDMRPQDYSNDG